VIERSGDVAARAWSPAGVTNWVIELDELPSGDAQGVEEAERFRAEFVGAVVEAATLREPQGPWLSAVPCVVRQGRKRCGGRTQVEYAADRGEVEWSCTRCGQTGVVRGFVGSESDLSRYVPDGKQVNWGVDDEERTVLLGATAHLPALRAVIARSKPHLEVAGLLLIRATVAELNELYTLVEQLSAGTRSRKRRELYDELRASLSTSIDGF
jgi:hypothetical protein